MASENGWEPSHAPPDLLEWRTIPGTNPPVNLQFMKGWPSTVMTAYAADFNAYIEPLRDGDSASFTPTNSVATSNHLNGTAMDLNWELHPFQVDAERDDRGGFDAAKIQRMRELLDFYNFEGLQIMFWAQDWDSPKDAMHHQMGYSTWKNPKVLRFIEQRIRADGFSTYKRGGTPVPAPPTPAPASNAADILARATGLSIGRATEILPTVVSGLHAAECNNVNRIAMWLAQCGEESAGFSTTEEFASGAEYEGRCSDLGNCSPGDGVKYKGRTWIQITGKAHYREFSQWAFGKGLTSSPTQFVDDPASLGDLRWAGIGAAWYWTVSRPDINTLSDAGDVVTVTHRINGGEHGLADRQNRYARAHALGDQLLTLTSATPSTPGDDDLSAEAERMITEMHRELTQHLPSRSPLRHLGEGTIDTLAGFVLNIDSSQHAEIVQLLASLGHPQSLALLREVANADPAKYPDRQSDRLIAQAILADITSAPAPVSPTSAPAAPAAPASDTRELAAAYAENARLREENARLQAQAAQAASTPTAELVPLESTNGSTSMGDIVKTVVDAVEKLKLADALTIQDRATLAASIKILEMKNGAKI